MTAARTGILECMVTEYFRMNGSWDVGEIKFRVNHVAMALHCSKGRLWVADGLVSVGYPESTILSVEEVAHGLAAGLVRFFGGGAFFGGHAALGG